MPEKVASLKYHPGVRSMRGPLVICVDIDSLLKK